MTTTGAKSRTSWWVYRCMFLHATRLLNDMDIKGEADEIEDRVNKDDAAFSKSTQLVGGTTQRCSIIQLADHAGMSLLGRHKRIQDHGQRQKSAAKGHRQDWRPV